MLKPQVSINNDGKAFILFFKPQNINGVCSNWYMSNFTIEGVEFNCVEQYMMYKKAMLFKDEQTAQEILADKNPANMKKYGRKVKNFDSNTWDKNKLNIVYTGVFEKFKQNKELNDWMMSIKNCDYFVECSPYDAIWGVKLSADDPRVLDKNKWQGENLLGAALKITYDNLKRGYK